MEYGVRGRGKATLEYRQGEANGAGTFVVAERLGAVELLTDIVGDFTVEACFGFRQPVRHGMSDAFWEQWTAIELQQVLLDHATHQVGDFYLVDTVAEAALESVSVEQPEKELKVLFLPIVRCRRHQQKMARKSREKLAQPVALRVLDLAPEKRCRHLVRLVADNEVVVTVRCTEFGLSVVVARELVETCNGKVVFKEPVACTGRFELVIGHDLERKVEPPVQLVLPLLDEVAWADHQATVEIAPRD